MLWTSEFQICEQHDPICKIDEPISFMYVCFQFINTCMNGVMGYYVRTPMSNGVFLLIQLNFFCIFKMQNKYKHLNIFFFNSPRSRDQGSWHQIWKQLKIPFRKTDLPDKKKSPSIAQYAHSAPRRCSDPGNTRH